MKLVALAALLVAGCGGKTGTLSLDLIVSPVDDPFAEATQVRFIIGDMTHVKTFPVQSGHFNISIDLSPIKQPGPVLVDALDAAGNIVAHGQTPALSLSAVNQGPIAVWMGRPGRAAAATAALPTPRAEMSSTAIPGLGILYAGGRGADGAALAKTAVYDIFRHTIIETTPLTNARAGAAAVTALNIRAVVIGGATAPGLGATGAPLPSGELFDPTTGLGVWSPVPSDPIDARSHANLILLSSGTALYTGGADGAGMPLATGALITTQAMARISSLATPMAAPRLGHVAAPVTLPAGAGALLFGGLAAGSTAPVAEVLTGQTFSAINLGPLDNRVGATATTLASGKVIILGGRTPSAAAVASGLLIDFSTATPTVMPLGSALSTARVDHTATLVNGDLLVCGGADAAGVVQASCDLLDGATLGLKKTIALGTGRRGHSAELLETGPVVLAGGLGSDGAPLASMEIYTP